MDSFTFRFLDSEKGQMKQRNGPTWGSIRKKSLLSFLLWKNLGIARLTKWWLKIYISEHSTKTSLTFNHQLDGKQKKLSFVILGRYMNYFQQPRVCKTWVFWDLGFSARLKEMKFNKFSLLREKLNSIWNCVPNVCLQSSKFQNIVSYRSKVINEDYLSLYVTDT